MRMNKIPEKPRLLGILKDAGFDVPDFLFMSGEDFDQGNFNKLKDFLDHSCSSFKVIVRMHILWRIVSREGHLIHWRQTVMSMEFYMPAIESPNSLAMLNA